MSPAKALSRSLFQREGGGKGVLVYYSDIFKQLLLIGDKDDKSYKVMVLYFSIKNNAEPTFFKQKVRNDWRGETK